MKRFGFSILLLAFCFLNTASKAAAYWMEVTGSGKINEPVRIQVCYGNIDEYSIRHRDTGAELIRTGDFKMSVIDDKGQTQSIIISQKTDCWEGTFTPARQGTYRILGINNSHPVVDRSKTRGRNVRPVDYLCSAYLVGNPTPVAIIKDGPKLDIISTLKDGIVNVLAFKDGVTAAKGTTLRVFNPENWEKELTVNEKGEALFKPTMKGLYIIREDLDDAVAGVYKNVAYSSTRYRFNYCLLVQ